MEDCCYQRILITSDDGSACRILTCAEVMSSKTKKKHRIAAKKKVRNENSEQVRGM